MQADFDVVIVGGGAAGIGSARHLAGKGLSVLLLEAQSRLGGRAWTQEMAGHELDLGCGWLHSAEKNSLAVLAQEAGLELDRSRAQWGIQYRDLGFTPAQQAAARAAMARWMRQLAGIRETTDRAADALDPHCEWNDYIQTIVGFVSGATLDRLSAVDYLAYDETSTDSNWRTTRGVGALVASACPEGITLRLGSPVQSLELKAEGMEVRTPVGRIRARGVVLAVSTAVITDGGIELPRELDPWREAASRLPLGRDEKLFLEITGSGPFERETQVIGNPRRAGTGSYYIRPLGLPVIECFLGGEAALVVERDGAVAAFAFALEELVALFGADIRRVLRPLGASGWGRSRYIGGAYSYALPGEAGARRRLAEPFEGRIFFAGEATSVDEFSTVHGAFDSGRRAAEEVLASLSG